LSPLFAFIKRHQKKSSTTKLPCRNPLSAHLRREEIRLEPEGDVSGLKKIGNETTEELEYVPPELYVKKYIRAKYAKLESEGIVIAALPKRPIDKGIVPQSRMDHQPLYRQQQQFRRQKVEIAERTLGGWVKACGEALLPLYEIHRALMQQAFYLMVDETPLPVLNRIKPDKTHLGYHWVYYDPVAKFVLFDYRSGRSRAGPNDILKNFHGYLQCDGYTGMMTSLRDRQFWLGLLCSCATLF